MEVCISVKLIISSDPRWVTAQSQRAKSENLTVSDHLGVFNPSAVGSIDRFDLLGDLCNELGEAAIVMSDRECFQQA